MPKRGALGQYGGGARCRARAKVTALALAGAWLAVGLLRPSHLLALPPERPARIAAIPALPLAQALAAYARKTGVAVVYLSDVVQGQHSAAVPAGLSADAALTRLLKGTGLRFENLTTHSVRILKADAPPGTPAMPSDEQQEVVVTATSLNESNIHASLDVVTWTQEDLQQWAVKDVIGVAHITPGVEFDAYQDYSAGIETNISIRGINARDGSTVAIYVDDLPIPSDRASTFGRAYPLAFDLERVEILRGSQGTLMGEGAEGGAVRFISAQPSVTTYSGLARGEYASTAGGAPSYEAGASFGGPLVPGTSGFHLSGWSRRDGGYVDRVDPFTGATVDANSNWLQREAFSGALTFAADGGFEVTPAVSYQSAYAHDTSAFYEYLSDPGDGILRNGKLVRQPYLDRHDLLSLKIRAPIGTTEFVAESGYLSRWASAVWDETNLSSRNFPNPLGPEYPVSYADAAPTDLSLRQHVLSQQAHLASTDPEARLRWLVGAGYTYAHYVEVQDLVTESVEDNGDINGRVSADRSTIQFAGFGTLEIALQRRLTALIGLRVEHLSYDSFQRISSDFGIPSEQQERIVGDATPVAPTLALSFQADRHSLYYARVAKGYRGGGPNIVLASECGSQPPPSYGPDYVWTFELGAKNELLEGRVQTDGSVFHMIWHNMQTQIPEAACSIGYIVNSGAASSDGLDLGAQVALTDRVSLRVTAAYANARYTQTVYAGHQVVVGGGDALGELPLVPSPLNATAAANYKVPLAAAASVTLRAQDVFHSRNPGPFTTQNPDAAVYAPERTADPATNQFDLTAILKWRAFDLSAFMINAFNSQPTLQRRNRSPGDTLFYAVTLRPRTVGLALNWALDAPSE